MYFQKYTLNYELNNVYNDVHNNCEQQTRGAHQWRQQKSDNELAGNKVTERIRGIIAQQYFKLFIQNCPIRNLTYNF
jgi:hypothetical protein